MRRRTLSTSEIGGLYEITAAETAQLNALCKKFRIDVLTVLHEKQTGHPGGSLSVCEILTTLYFKEMNVRPDEPQWAERDRLVLSKGPRRADALSRAGGKRLFPVEEMHTLRDFETRLQGHPCARETPGVDASTGPLGMGLSAAVGMAVGLRMNGSDARVYAILGDGEIEEGTIWEACMSANKFKVDNLWRRPRLERRAARRHERRNYAARRCERKVPRVRLEHDRN